MKRKSVVRSSTVNRLKRRVSVLSLRVRELEEAVGHLQSQSEMLKRIQQEKLASLVYRPDLELSEVIEC